MAEGVGDTQVTVVIFSPVAFDFLPQRPHQLAKAFAELGCRAVYVGPVENAVSMGMKRLLGRGTPLDQNTGVDVLRIRRYAVPEFDIPLSLHNTSPEKIREYIRRRLKKLIPGSDRRAAIIENPVQIQYIPYEDFDVVCYDCIDDFSVITSGKVEENLRFQQEVLRNSHVVFITAESLRSEIQRHSGDSVRAVGVPNGVDYEWFQQQVKMRRSTPVLATEKPIIGYVGAVFNWVDIGLVLETARLRKVYEFVLVGPMSKENKKKVSARIANVKTPGEVRHAEVPSFIQAFSACMIPFKQGAVAQSTDPIKLYEYFALGKPVVATRMAQLEQYRGLLRLAESPAQFAQAIDAVLREDSEAKRSQRRAIARAHSWKSLAQKMLHAINAVGR